MCGIFSIFDKPGIQRSYSLKLSKLQRHRGPDYTGTFEDPLAIICHERLAIVDPDSGDQPLYNSGKTVILGVNGEIYNYREIREDLLKKGHEFLSGSDCEVFVHLYAEYGERFLEMVPIHGMYALVLYDKLQERLFVARDPVGIIPLYYGFGEEGSMWVASELKAIIKDTPTHFCFPPGHLYDSDSGNIIRFCEPRFLFPDQIPTRQVELSQIRDALIEAVKSHLMADVPFGVLLSGGLDSSLVASIMARFLDGRLNNEGQEATFYRGKLHSFTIGLEGSPDLEAAKHASKFLNTHHHSYEVQPQELLDALDDVIYHLETYDVTTIRASTPMYLMSRKIKATGVKMVLSGEGADEIFGGYLYFHKCPSSKEFHRETCLKVSQLQYYDCLRANKSMMAWGVETRVPFLDTKFLDFALNIDPRLKMCGGETKKMEKHILRAAFDVRLNGEGETADPWLPNDILWRQKEQFSDGVGYNWIDQLKVVADKKVTDRMMKSRKYRFPVNTPNTKEAYLGRMIFQKHFPGEAAAQTVLFQDSIACSTKSAILWSEEFKNREDCSGRSVANVHKAAYNENWDKSIMKLS